MIKLKRHMYYNFIKDFEKGTTLHVSDFDNDLAGRYISKKETYYHFIYKGLDENGEPRLVVQKYCRCGQNWGWYICDPTKELIKAFKWA